MSRMRFFTVFKRLCRAGVRMTLPVKPNSRLRKCHLTQKGRNIIAKLAKKEVQ